MSIVSPVKTVAGRLVCCTTYDGRGRAHLEDPETILRTACGRELEGGGVKPNGKSCHWCARVAVHANRRLRDEIESQEWKEIVRQLLD